MHVNTLSTHQLLLADNIIEDQVIKTWQLKDQQIVAVQQQETVRFYLEKQGKKRAIPHYFIAGLPTAWPMDIFSSKTLLSDMSVRIAPLGQAQYKLYFTAPLLGGGHICRDTNKVWKGGRIPYEIDFESYPIASEHRWVIQQAINSWSIANTGFVFVPRTNEEDFLFFGEDNLHYCYLADDFIEHVEKDEAFSDQSNDDDLYNDFLGLEHPHDVFMNSLCGRSVGFQGGKQYVRCVIDKGSLNKRSIMHQIGHAIGLYHEHQRYDRDNYVEVSSRRKHKVENKEYDKYSFEYAFGRYDFCSIMHSPIEVELVGGICLTSHIEFPTMRQIGTKAVLSSGDIAAAKALAKEAKVLLRQEVQSLDLEAFSRYIPSTRGEPLSPKLTCIDVPQWQKMKEKADRYYKQNFLKEAFDTYNALIVEYEAVINEVWLAHPLMIRMVAQWHFRCGRCLSEAREDYKGAAHYMLDAIDYLVDSEEYV